MKTILLVTAITLTCVSGCSSFRIEQKIEPTNFRGASICVVENPLVQREEFRSALMRSLTAKGLHVRTVGVGQATDGCPAIVNYGASWATDVGTRYLQTAQVTIHQAGVLAGRAIYDSSEGGLNMGKWVQADEKAAEFVQKLFPDGPAVWPLSTAQ